jgi:alpha-glucosidase
VLDPGGRDGCRAPIPWSPAADHGWGTDDPWLPWPPDADTRNAESAAADASSVLGLYRDLLAARNESKALQLGDFRWLGGAPDDVLAFERTDGSDHRVVLVNYADAPQSLDGLDVAGLSTVLTSDGRPFDGQTLGPDQAVILRR